jgi:VCBS repeat-containing protein
VAPLVDVPRESVRQTVIDGNRREDRVNVDDATVTVRPRDVHLTTSRDHESARVQAAPPSRSTPLRSNHTMRTITGLRVSAAAAGAVAALAFIPSGANAAFDSAHDTQCESPASIAGRGASFQRQAQLAWGAQQLAPDPAAAETNGFGYATTANGGCSAFQVGASNGNTVTFEPKGSGDGRKAVGASTEMGAPASGTTPAKPREAGIRDSAIQFGAADEPPTAQQIAAANEGPEVTAADNAVLLTIPVAQSSIAPVVKLPAGCTVPLADHRISRARLEGTFAGKSDFDTWGELFPTIAGSGCAEKPLTRVVRSDSSGTTFGFKNYLRDIPGYTADFATAPGNTEWPNNTGTTAVARPGSAGAGALLDLLNSRSTEGGIGYADLAAARSKGFDTDVQGGTLPGTTTPNPDVGKPDVNDTSFWLTVERRDGAFQSPALSDTKGTANTGSNCRNVSYADATTGKLPAVTETWTNVTASASTADYPLCVLTYELVWQDMVKANVGLAPGKPAYTQSQARSVKDYLGYILNAGGGQAALAPNGYQGLPSVDAGTGTAVPSSVLDVAQAGQRSLTWNGAPVVVTPPPAGDGGGTTTTTPVVTTPVVVPTTTTPATSTTTPAPAQTTPKPAATPAAKLTISKAAGLKGRKISLTVSPSAAGKVGVTATTVRGKKTVTLGKGTVTVKKGGKLVLTITPSKAGKRALTAGRTVTVKFKVTFTATTGKKVTVTKSIKVKVKR